MINIHLQNPITIPHSTYSTAHLPNMCEIKVSRGKRERKCETLSSRTVVRNHANVHSNAFSIHFKWFNITENIQHLRQNIIKKLSCSLYCMFLSKKFKSMGPKFWTPLPFITDKNKETTKHITWATLSIQVINDHSFISIRMSTTDWHIGEDWLSVRSRKLWMHMKKERARKWKANLTLDLL